MLSKEVEIIPIGPVGDLFQVTAGLVYAHLEMASVALPPDEAMERVVLHPDVIDFINQWVEENGVLLGTPHPPRLSWEEVRRQVPAARFL
ncbi:hypothetical protein GXW78_27255 [Roseomonas terrae]|uniref:Uncharacterized protein n=1 Tax=Neoroseomonas terrae TaxID=424799 RepID=A0ABS5EQS8_9PROT|nr:hypothetical protein [Neoroseomonas terrae]MBR0653378.1 hypothetical protein [Neoroseomonas terrae]